MQYLSHTLSDKLRWSLPAYYLQQCPRDEAQINECLKESGNKLVHYLQKGVPELDIYEVRAKVYLFWIQIFHISMNLIYRSNPFRSTKSALFWEVVPMDIVPSSGTSRPMVWATSLSQMSGKLELIASFTLCLSFEIVWVVECLGHVGFEPHLTLKVSIHHDWMWARSGGLPWGWNELSEQLAYHCSITFSLILQFSGSIKKGIFMFWMQVFIICLDFLNNRSVL